MALIASAANYASIRIVRTMVIVSIRLIAMCANVQPVMPKMIVPSTSTSALAISVRMARLASTVSPITPVCATLAGRDGYVIVISTNA